MNPLLKFALYTIAGLLVISWFVSYFIFRLPAGTLSFILIVAIVLIIITIIDYHG